MVYLTRKEHFNAAHKLYNPAWSKEKNAEIFGKCANENWHGHNYTLYVTIKGEVNAETGYLYDAKALSRLVDDKVLEKVDHRNLNLDVDFMAGKICSTENLAIAIWEQLEPHLEGVQLHCIKLYETERIYVEYFGK
ncbi:MAG TPA: 6-carboxytetrahydropterin synthase [Chitinophagaceae bacterium]|jgi:6-pyruvoyltetrahydropterin/6-carboxytetrahydropterin synthase|nr:6-carboxytetrahydropterin synthase [Chitinophagaceae bacterium]